MFINKDQRVIQCKLLKLKHFDEIASATVSSTLKRNGMNRLRRRTRLHKIDIKR